MAELGTRGTIERVPVGHSRLRPRARHISTRLLEQALDIALEKKDPQRKLERRKARQRRQNASKAQPRPDEVSGDVAPGVEDEPARSRYVPSEAIERVHARGNHQCNVARMIM